MQIGELFVSLGFKGADKANKDLVKTKDNMVGLTKKTIGMIGALAGVTIGLSALYNRAVGSGTALTKFSNFTGKSSKELQKWQYIAMEAGVAGAEVENSFRRLSEIAGDFNITGNFPAELQKIAEVTGGLDLDKLDDADYMLRKIQAFLQSGAETQSVLNNIAGGLVGQDMIQFLNQNRKDPSQVPDSAIMSDQTAKALQKTKADFDKFFKDLEVRFARLFVKVAPDVLPRLKELAVEVVNLSEALINFLSRNKVFEMMGHVIKAMTKALQGDYGGAADEMAKFGNLELNLLRGGAYEQAINDYVTPWARPISNAADAGIQATINVFQDLSMASAANKQEYKSQALIGAQKGAGAGVKIIRDNAAPQVK